MRAFLPNYELIAPKRLEEVLRVLATGEGWQPFAGGTDLMVLLEAGKLVQKKFVNVWQLRELREIRGTAGQITIGALTTYTDVQRNATLQREYPLLCRAASETGSIATQNRGTLGGNIANASPAADSPPALLVYDAELEIISARGMRRVAYRDFHSGYKKMDLRPDELIASIRLSRSFDGWQQYYRKVGTRRAQAISKTCFAGAARIMDGKLTDVHIAMGSVAPVPLRCVKTEAILRGQTLDAGLIRRAQEELGREISPIDDFRSTAKYRRRVSQNLLAEFLSTLAA